eukprot:7853450-Prorocentrum_lima.AAC.1
MFGLNWFTPCPGQAPALSVCSVHPWGQSHYLYPKMHKATIRESHAALLGGAPATLSSPARLWLGSRGHN